MVNSLFRRLPTPPVLAAARPLVRAVVLSPHKVVAALAVALVLILATLILTAHSTRGIVTASERTAHAQQTLVLSGRLLTTLNEAETAHRSYLLTGDEKYFNAYAHARTRYPGEFAALRAQLASRLEVATLVASLQVQLDARFAEFVHTLELRQEDGLTPSLASLSSDAGWRASGEIRNLLQTLQSSELDDLASDSDSIARRAESFQSLGLGLAELAVALSVLCAFLLLRRVRRLEHVVKICAWTHRVLWQNRWISFEQYLAERFQVDCTHGICDEAALRMEQEILATPIPDELRADGASAKAPA
jgi:CHASE3 domain sensor protein